MAFHYKLFLIAATETELPERVAVAVQCDLLAAPPLQKLTPSTTEPSLDDSFITETEQEDKDADLDVSFTCSQSDYSTEYVYI